MAFRELGFMHLGLPEEVGGIPCDKLTLVLLMEKLHEYTTCVLPFQTDFNSIMDVIEFGNEDHGCCEQRSKHERCGNGDF